MTHDQAAALIHALIDGELDAGHAREVERHVASCPACSAQLTNYRDLREAIGSSKPRYTAPASLRARIDREVPVPAAMPSRRALLKGFAIGSAVTAAAAAGVTFVIVGHDRDDLILSEAVSAHLRSLQADHLTDVLSSNQHTVKPWFNGRIDLAPPVYDLTAQGFTLIGGRLDYIDDKPVAAIVYRRRVHVINLFVMQGPGPKLPSSKLENVQGFNVLRWRDRNFNLMAVSDLAADELEEFQARFEAAAKAARQG